MTPPLVDLYEESAQELEDAIVGLSANPKTLPCKYFYDETGSRLFDRITELAEYYPTRTELAILKDNAATIGEALGEGTMLIEYGAGSCIKTRTVLRAVSAPAGFMPIDISGEHLRESAATLARQFPDLEIIPVCADYTRHFDIPAHDTKEKSRVVFFPGSTIGNFHPADAVDFLRRIREVAGSDGGLLIGVDLKKDRTILERAYNDSEGITAAFNLNLLVRLNREIGTNFNLDAFSHDAIFNEELGRIEMHLVSAKAQRVTAGDRTFDFTRGESIRTECSYKYTAEEFKTLAARAGFDRQAIWTDRDNLFSVHYYRSR